jgi:glutaredoxin 3
MSMSRDPKAPHVIVYSTTWCAYCRMAKEYLQSKGIEFKDIDVEKDSAAAKDIVAKTGQMGVPVIEVNDQIILGFDRPRLDTALGLA